MPRILLALVMLVSHTTALLADTVKLRCESNDRGSDTLILTISQTSATLRLGNSSITYVDERQRFVTDGQNLPKRNQRRLFGDIVWDPAQIACNLSQTEYVSEGNNKLRFGLISRNVNRCGIEKDDSHTGPYDPPSSEDFYAPGEIHTGSTAYVLDLETGILEGDAGRRQCEVFNGNAIPLGTSH